jgi:hypothetical protein
MQHPITAATTMPAARLAAHCALAAALTVAGLFASFLIFGPAGGQDQLQAVRPPTEYVELLLTSTSARRFAIGLDNLFIALYSIVFVLLAVLLQQRGRLSSLATAALGLLALLGVLDLLENMHFLTLLAAAEQGLPISAAQIELQVWESLVKFHVGYVGLFMLGWVFPQETWLERAFCFALRWIQLPVGMLIYLTPQVIAVPLLIVRTAFFLLALLALHAILRRWQSDSDAQE